MLTLFGLSGRRQAAAGFLIALLPVMAVPAAGAADPERGRLLYDNHCQFCHNRQVHGRPDPWPKNLADLRRIVDQWQRNDRLRWSDAEVDDVTAYLNATQYRFKE